ncbi:MAG: hypothetical protein Q9222_007497, partial [Ikaeria aurantiellina]
MAAAPQFAAHPGAMASHAGMPHGGHPMAQGHPSQQGMPGGGQQPGVTMPQQMHIGPGGSQPGQQGPMMGGMMPGAGPGASSGNGGPSMHALSHLTPGHPSQMLMQQQQQQQQQQQSMHQAMQNNPQLLQQYQQQQMQLRRMQMQQAQQQQMAQGGGMAMGPGNNPMNPAQFRANQANPNMRAPGALQNHLQQQQQQQAQINREQQQQQQQQQHHTQQQQHNQVIAQQMAMQQAASQAGSNQPQPASQQQPRPPSQMAGGPDGQPVVGNQQHSQMQQQHSQQQPQASQQAQPPQQAQQQSQQQPQPSSQQQNQQQMQSQQAQGQQSSQQHHQAQQAQVQAHHAQQQAAAAMLQNRIPTNLKGGHILKVFQFGDQLGNFSTKKRSNDLRFWQMFVDNFFSQAGVIRQQLYYPSDQSTKQYEISPTPTLARYYFTQFNSGVQNIQMILEKFREHDLPNGGHIVTSEKSSFIYWLTNGHQLVTSGGLKVQFDAMSKIEVLEILTTSHDEYVPRAQLLRSATESPEMKHSPNQSKATGKKANQQRQKQAQAAQDQTPVAAIPNTTINDQGVTPSVQQFLE